MLLLCRRWRVCACTPHAISYQFIYLQTHTRAHTAGKEYACEHELYICGCDVESMHNEHQAVAREPTIAIIINITYTSLGNGCSPSDANEHAY